jgi:hypothetical protein
MEPVEEDKTNNDYYYYYLTASRRGVGTGMEVARNSER